MSYLMLSSLASSSIIFFRASCFKASVRRELVTSRFQGLVDINQAMIGWKTDSKNEVNAWKYR